MARQIVVEVVGDASGLTKATATATDHLGKMQSVVNGMALGVGIAAVHAVQSAVGDLTGQVLASGQAFRDDQVSQEKLFNVLKNTVPEWDKSTKGVEAFAGAQARLGFQDDDVRDSLGTLVGITHDITKAQEDSALAMDLARAKGIDLASATDIVAKAAQGNGKALKGMGIDIGTAKTGAEMLDQIQKNVKGSAEAWSETSQGKLAASQVKNAESWEKIGKVVDKLQSVFLPLLADAFTALADAIDPVIQFVSDHADVFKAIGIGIGVVAAVIFAMMIPALIAMAGAAIAAAIPMVILAAPFIVLGLVVAGLAYLIITHFGVIKNIIGQHVNIIIGVFNVLKGWLTSIVPAAFAVLVAVVVGIPTKIASAAAHMWDGIKNSFKAVLNAIIGMWNRLHFSLPKVDVGPIHTPAFDMKVPQIPYFHAGGIVPGAPGQDVLAMLQAGERVSPAGANGGPQNVFNFNIGTYVGDASTLSKMLAKELRLTGVAFK